MKIYLILFLLFNFIFTIDSKFIKVENPNENKMSLELEKINNSPTNVSFLDSNSENLDSELNNSMDVCFTIQGHSSGTLASVKAWQDAISQFEELKEDLYCPPFSGKLCVTEYETSSTCDGSSGWLANAWCTYEIYACFTCCFTEEADH